MSDLLSLKSDCVKTMPFFYSSLSLVFTNENSAADRTNALHYATTWKLENRCDLVTQPAAGLQIGRTIT